MRRAFTLPELLVGLSIVAVLVTMLLPAAGKLVSQGQGAKCANSLRQLSVATELYLQEHDRRFFRYSLMTPEGKLWYFGLEPLASLGRPEGERTLIRARAPLYPYIQSAGGVEICPSFPYGQALSKPKFQGASYGYGFNTLLSGQNALMRERPSQVILFGDCAQVNTFQKPASPKNPMLEEFYIIDHKERSIHFRHGTRANILFLDGHVAPMELLPGTESVARLPGQVVGRITPAGSMQYLQ